MPLACLLAFQCSSGLTVSLSLRPLTLAAALAGRSLVIALLVKPVEETEEFKRESARQRVKGRKAKVGKAVREIDGKESREREKERERVAANFI